MQEGEHLKRDRATELLKDLVRRAVGDAWPVKLVEAVYVFGSYARGSVEPGDVDVAVDIDRTDEWRSHFVGSFSRGRDPYTELRMALRGRTRSVEILFERHAGHDDVPMALVWRRGEALETAFERIDRIVPDPTAGRAERDAMLPAFEGLEHWLPRYVREELVRLIEEGLLVVERVDLHGGWITDDQVVRHHLDARWTSTSVLRRAAEAALGYLCERGIDLHTVHLHGVDVVRGATTPYFVGFNLRHFGAMLYCFEEHEGVEWIEVVHPTQTQPLVALRCRPTDVGQLAEDRRRTFGNHSSFFR